MSVTIKLPPATTTMPTASRLRAAVLAGPLFAVVSFAQMPVREGFDLARHPFSFLLNGPGAWIQTVNFVVTGALYLAAAPGLRAAFGGRGGAVAAVLAGVLGTGQIIAGLAHPDPAFGYPAGAPAGMPEHLSVGSIVHGIAFAVSVVSWCALMVVMARLLHRRGERGWAALAALTAVALLVVPALSGTPIGTVVINAVVTPAFVVMSALCAHLSSTATD